MGNAISFSQTQDGFLSKVDSALRRMSELATLSADQTKAADDVANYEKEFVELKEFITRTASKDFNGVGLFSSATLADKDLSSTNLAADIAKFDALIKTQLDTTLKAAFDGFVGAPDNLADDTTFSYMSAVTSGAVVTNLASHGGAAAAHNLDKGQSVVVLDKGESSGLGVGTTYYAGDITANTFALYTDKALTTLATMTAASDGSTAAKSLIIESKGNYDKLQTLRQEIGNMAMEWEQKETGTVDRQKQDWSGGALTAANAGTADGTKTWQNTYDFWQSKIGDNWTGLLDHVDAVDRQAANIVNQGSLTDSLTTEYKKMYSAIRSYINNNGAGLEITDNSAATSYQLKGADVSFITDAIAASTDTNSVFSDLTKTNGASYVTNINNLINDLAGTRAYVGANMSRLNMVSSQLAVYGENLSAANSRIEDIDIARETANFSKQQILVQSGTAMLAQANVLPQSALQLLQ